VKAIDTNVLVRFLVNDDPVQAEQVRQLFATAEQSRDAFYIPLLVLLETIWVLQSAYQVKRADLIETLAELLLMPVLRFEQREAVQAMLDVAATTNLELPDALIAQSAVQMGCDGILTFDQKAARGPAFVVL
jgi:predicted nucleic-acid-binding protein